MARIESAPLKLLPSSDDSSGAEGARVIVALHGEHDIATVAELTETLAQAMDSVDGDLVVDLADVDFLGAATASVLIRAHEELQRRNRMLFLRSPNASARRVLRVCGFGKLFDWAPEVTHIGSTTGALATWVAVPVRDRDGTAAPPPSLVSVEPAQRT